MAKHYYISFNSTDFSEIFPVNNPIASYRELEGTHIWREEVDEIKLPRTTNETVYDTLHSYFTDKTKFDVEIEVEIYTGVRATGTLYWKGLFSISDTSDDFQNTVAKLNPIRVNDKYLDILSKAEVQYELSYGTQIIEQLRVGYVEEIGTTGAWVNGSINTAFDTLTAAGGTITQASAGAGVGYEAYVAINTGVAADDIIIVDVKSLTTNTTPTFEIMQGAGTVITDEGAKTLFEGTMGFTISTGASAPRLWLQSLPGDTTNTVFTLRKIKAANDHTSAGELLLDFIEQFLKGVNFMYFTDYSGNVVSTFLNNDALPTGAPSTISTFMTANANGNYVSLTTDNEMNTAIIGMLIEWFAENEQPSIKMSFNDIMGYLRDMFQIYWYIDADDKFRIEHEKFFVKMVDDSTPITLSNYPNSEADAREFKYEKSRIASTETFAWAQANYQDFVGRSIIYNNFESTDTTKGYSLSNITTDMQYVIDNLDEAANAGLGIYQCSLLTGITGDDLYTINIATGALSNDARSNAAFSWANLHEKYWSWSRMAESATLNSAATSFQSAVRFLEQKNVKFFYSTAIDPFTKIVTSLTGGAPIEIRRDLETDFVEMIIGFDPYQL